MLAVWFLDGYIRPSGSRRMAPCAEWRGDVVRLEEWWAERQARGGTIESDERERMEREAQWPWTVNFAGLLSMRTGYERALSSSRRAIAISGIWGHCPKEDLEYLMSRVRAMEPAPCVVEARKKVPAISPDEQCTEGMLATALVLKCAGLGRWDETPRRQEWQNDVERVEAWWSKRTASGE